MTIINKDINIYNKDSIGYQLIDLLSQIIFNSKDLIIKGNNNNYQKLIICDILGHFSSFLHKYNKNNTKTLKIDLEQYGDINDYNNEDIQYFKGLIYNMRYFKYKDNDNNKKHIELLSQSIAYYINNTNNDSIDIEIIVNGFKFIHSQFCYTYEYNLKKFENFGFINQDNKKVLDLNLLPTMDDYIIQWYDQAFKSKVERFQTLITNYLDKKKELIHEKDINSNELIKEEKIEMIMMESIGPEVVLYRYFFYLDNRYNLLKEILENIKEQKEEDINIEDIKREKLNAIIFKKIYNIDNIDI
jgi:hypothetical protein